VVGRGVKKGGYTEGFRMKIFLKLFKLTPSYRSPKRRGDKELVKIYLKCFSGWIILGV